MASNDILALVKRHQDAFVKGDLDALMADYSDDAVLLVKGAPPAEGKAAIRALFQIIFEQVFQPAQTTLTFGDVVISGSGELVLAPFAAETPHVKTVGAQDTFTIRNGKITGQTGGGDIVPK